MFAAAVQHMTTYWSILEKMKGSKLRLTKMDDEIYEHFRKEFPEFDPTETIDEDKMKSKEGKERWRNFMLTYEKTVEDYNFGTMLRSNPKFEYGEKETIFGLQDPCSSALDSSTNWARQRCACNSTLLRSQGKYADATLSSTGLNKLRNRQGLNDWIYKQAHPNEDSTKT
jgi:hypothetical protein